MHQVAAQGIFTVYRHINQLTIENWEPEVVSDILTTIINNLTRISCLKIPFLFEDTPELTMPSLKELHIDSITTKENLQAVISNQNDLVKLCVKWIRDFDINDVIEQSTIGLNQLQHLAFGPKFKPSYETLKTFKESCSNLETLELFYDLSNPISENILNTINGNGLKVYLHKKDFCRKIFQSIKNMWSDEDLYVKLSSHPSGTSDTESMDDTSSDDDFDFGDSDDDDSFDNNPFYYYSDSDEMDLEDYMMREVIGFLIN
jgi:hypothetical protein